MLKAWFVSKGTVYEFLAILSLRESNSDVPYSSLGEYVDLYGYGTKTKVTVQGRTIEVLPLAHPRQIGALGAHSEKWFLLHKKWKKG